MTHDNDGPLNSRMLEALDGVAMGIEQAIYLGNKSTARAMFHQVLPRRQCYIIAKLGESMGGEHQFNAFVMSITE